MALEECHFALFTRARVQISFVGGAQHNTTPVVYVLLREHTAGERRAERERETAEFRLRFSCLSCTIISRFLLAPSSIVVGVIGDTFDHQLYTRGENERQQQHLTCLSNFEIYWHSSDFWVVVQSENERTRERNIIDPGRLIVVRDHRCLIRRNLLDGAIALW